MYTSYVLVLINYESIIYLFENNKLIEIYLKKKHVVFFFLLEHILN